MHLEHNPQSWNQVNQQTLKESPPPKIYFKQPRHHVVDPEEVPACPRRCQVRQDRGAQQAPGAQAVSPVPLIKLAIHLMWSRAIAILFFSLASTPTGALTSLSCTNCKVSRCTLPPVSITNGCNLVPYLRLLHACAYPPAAPDTVPV